MVDIGVDILNQVVLIDLVDRDWRSCLNAQGVSIEQYLLPTITDLSETRSDLATIFTLLHSAVDFHHSRFTTIICPINQKRVVGIEPTSIAWKARGEKT
jgi:hypothetical protein